MRRVPVRIAISPFPNVPTRYVSTMQLYRTKSSWFLKKSSFFVLKLFVVNKFMDFRKYS